MTSRTVDTEGIAALLGLTRRTRRWREADVLAYAGGRYKRAATDCTGTAPVALRADSASHASGTMAGTAVSPPSHALMVRSDTPSAWAACCWV